jgi:hypothetical protein
VTIWYGSGFCFFSSVTFKTATINLVLKFFAYYFLKVHLHRFSKIKVIKKSQNRCNQGFSYYFCLMIEVSGSGSTKIIWIRIRITVRNSVQTKGTQDRFPIELIIQCAQDDFLLRHYDSGTCQGKLGHSRASVIWHRTQVTLKLTI